MEREQQPMRIYCKMNENLNMAARAGRVLLVRANPDDKSQHWFKDSVSIGRLKDQHGRMAFVLVNRVTGQAMVKRGSGTAVGLVSYTPEVAVEISMVWSQGIKLEGGFTEVRSILDHSETLNGFGLGSNGEGTVVGMFPSSPKFGNAVWKIEPISSD